MTEIPYNDLMTDLFAKRFRVPERVDYCANGDRIIFYNDGNYVRIPKNETSSDLIRYENKYNRVPMPAFRYAGKYGKITVSPPSSPIQAGDIIMKSDSTYGVALDNADTNGVVNITLTNNRIITSNLENQICTKEEIMNETISRAQAEALMAQAAKALEIVNERDKKFGEDIYNDGDILYADVKWCKREDSVSESAFKRQRVYKYAFIKAGGSWYSSGPRSSGVMFTWDQLVNFLSQRYLIRFGGAVRQKARVRKDKVVV